MTHFNKCLRIQHVNISGKNKGRNTTIYRLQYSNNHLQIVLKDLDLMWCGDIEMRGLL